MTGRTKEELASEILRKKITFLQCKRTQNYVTGHSYRFAEGKLKNIIASH